MKNTEQKLYDDLVELAHEIIRLKNYENIGSMKKTARLIYEKLSVLDFFVRGEPPFSKDTNAKKETTKPKKQTTETAVKNETIPEKTTHIKKTMPIEKMEIKNKIKEFKNTLPIEDGLKLFQQKSNKGGRKKRSPIRINFEDRLAFTKNLFEDDYCVFLDLCNHLTKIPDFETAKSFIKKNFYRNSWKEKTKYTEHFFNILKNYYSTD